MKKARLLIMMILFALCATALMACDGVTPPAKTLSGIEITAPPAKTTYTAGEIFSPGGMIVTANYSDGSNGIVTGYTYSTNPLSVTDTKVTVYYTESGVTKTADITVTVNSAGTVTNAEAPDITGQPQSAAVTVGATHSLTVTASVNDGGELSYQWFSNTSAVNTGGTQISGANGPVYNAPVAAAGTYYYYVEVTNTNNGVNGSKTAAVKSAVATLTVNNSVNAQTPANVNVQPLSATVTVGATHSLTVTASVNDGGTMSYQWYLSAGAVNTGGTQLSGAVSASYTVPTTAAGTFYYYCVVTNTLTDNGDGGQKTASAASNAVTVTVNEDACAITSAGDFEFLEDDYAFLKVPYSTTSFSFTNLIYVSQGASWVLYSDISGQNEISTNKINLAPGNNEVFILVTSQSGRKSPLYTFNVYRKDMYTVLFNTNGGTPEVMAQQVEEGGLAADPGTEATAKTGYTFKRWDFAFDGQVTGDITVNAEWTAKEYTVELDLNTGELNNADPVTVTYDSPYNLPVPQKEGYSFNGWSYSGNIITCANGNSLADWQLDITGKITVKAEFTINRYTLTLTANIAEAGNITSGGNYEYGEEITITAETTALGYTWLGWYDGNDLVYTDMSKTFNMPAKDAIYTATWQVAGELIDFTFTSDFETLTITGYTGASTDVVIPDISAPYTYLSATAFTNNTHITSIVIPDCIKYISHGTFKGCDNLESITLPFVGSLVGATVHSAVFGVIFGFETTTSASAAAPDGTTYQYDNGYVWYYYYIPASLRTVVITGNSAIKDNAFYNCYGLTRITLSGNVESIGTGAFYNCSGLTEIILPSSVTSIGGGAFQRVPLKYIVIPQKVTTIGVGVFHTPWPVVYAEAQSKPAGWNNDFFSADPIYYGVNENNFIITSEAHYVVRDGKAVLTFFTGGAASFNVPAQISTSEADINVTEIGSYAFRSSGVTNIILPENITSIGTGAFYDARSLTGIIIPSGVTTIGQMTFYDAKSLTNITIPSSVATIGAGAFNYCTALTKVFYGGANGTEWALIAVGSGNNPLTAVTRYYYSETEIFDGAHWRFVYGVPTVWS